MQAFVLPICNLISHHISLEVLCLYDDISKMRGRCILDEIRSNPKFYPTFQIATFSRVWNKKVTTLNRCKISLPHLIEHPGYSKYICDISAWKEGKIVETPPEGWFFQWLKPSISHSGRLDLWSLFYVRGCFY